MKRRNFAPSSKAVLCSDHFEEPCFDRTGQTVRLKPDALPTIFNFPAHLMPKSFLPRKERKNSTITLPKVDKAETDVGDIPSVSSHSVDHQYAIHDSPRKLKRKLEHTTDQMNTLKKKLKQTQQVSRRAKKKCQSLAKVVKILQQKGLISDNCAAMLETTFTGVPLEVMKRVLQNKSKKISRQSYPDVLKAFALTLQFYSTKAYRYVRKTFNLVLPHPSVIRRWYSSVNCQPGFTEEAFNALKVKSQDVGQDQVICALMIDEMSIRKHVEWNGKRMVGFVDVGTETEDDSTPVATEALVFMVVALNSNWKVPVGYFLIHGMTGVERANLVSQCIRKLHDVNVKVSSLTCDGPSCHFTMITELGASLDPSNMKPYFPHPVDNSSIAVFLDVCHMIKLMRNCLASGKILKDKDGNQIRWDYFEKLNKLQEKEGLRLANKLKMSHMDWSKQKMKVNLAAQTLSNSVADAIEFCDHHLKIDEFKNSKATIKFIRIVDRLFDILNSRNPLAKNFKAPIRSSNEHFWMPFLLEAFEYISKLSDNNGNLMTYSRRKTPFIGFMCAIKSLLHLYQTYVNENASPLKYLLTYKLSQDHLELFFCAVRSSGGSNNNPTASQFMASYKRLLMRHQIKASGGNCVSQDDTNILNAVKDYTEINRESTDTLNMSTIRRYDLDTREPVQDDHDYTDIPNFSSLSECKECAVSYIAGYVVRMVEKRICCNICIPALRWNVDSDKPNNYLTLFKDRGGLVKPSECVIRICLTTEQAFQRLLKTNNGRLPQVNGVKHAIAHSVLLDLNTTTRSVFPTLYQHMFDTTADNNHVNILIKCVTTSYCTIRLHHLAKQFTASITGEKVRKRLCKLVLFKHQ